MSEKKRDMYGVPDVVGEVADAVDALRKAGWNVKRPFQWTDNGEHAIVLEKGVDWITMKIEEMVDEDEEDEE